MKQLGNTLALIAAEKAGIIKHQVPVISGVVQDEPGDVIRKIADQHEAQLLERNRDFRYTNYRDGSWTELPQVNFECVRGGTWQPGLMDVTLGVHGEHQAANASVAWATLGLLPERLVPAEEATRRGFELTRCAARVEVVNAHPFVVIDTAHNPASAQALVNTLSQFPMAGCRWLILAATRGKEIGKMLQALLPHFDHIVCTQYLKNQRACDTLHLERLVNEQLALNRLSAEVTCCESPAEAWKFTQNSSKPDDCICITGSFFIAAEIREIM